MLIPRDKPEDIAEQIREAAETAEPANLLAALGACVNALRADAEVGGSRFAASVLRDAARLIDGQRRCANCADWLTPDRQADGKDIRLSEWTRADR